MTSLGRCDIFSDGVMQVTEGFQVSGFRCRDLPPRSTLMKLHEI
ncbi:hypothetical protein D1AOALGA4SA_5308 [Olavius algarvensis Delta 1 endosymbiont]|nr:hypothetical protein D1AOALGA4SA_5308 [Olavius algarvensis Delta 1 endosymbiont]